MNRLFQVFIIISLIITSLPSRANPVIWAPVMITELHLDSSGNWHLELNVVQDPMIFGDSTLDNFRIVTKAGIIHFNSGIPIHMGDVLVLTASDFQTPLSIDSEDEVIAIEQNMNGVGWSPIGFPLIIGSSLAYNCVPPLNTGQSAHLVYFLSFPMPVNYYYIKSNSPGLGDPFFDISMSLGLLQGQVLDAAMNPAPLNSVRIVSDQFPGMDFINSTVEANGHFSLPVCGRNILVSVADSSQNLVFADTVVAMEPDSGNFLDFILDTLLTGIAPVIRPSENSISTYPNPSTGITMIFIRTSSSKTGSAIVKIYNEQEEILGIIPVKQYSPNNTLSIPFSSANYNMKPGVYFLSLEIRGQKSCITKFILVQ
ncbi:MAG: T9SS type A sorting domain-containing protein [Bacteroidales bacterium]